MLELKSVNAGYGAARILRDVTFHAEAGEIVCLLGRNGAGKTTTMQTVMGLLRLSEGSVLLDGEEISRLPAHEVPKRGIGYIPQGRRLFSELTVAENIEIGLMTRGASRETRETVLALFPRLRERLGQRAETLSGGEQQMLATARALCLEPKVLLLDEPTEGLQPSMIDLIRNVVVQKKQDGVAIVLVEQRVDAVIEIADRVVFIENGRIQDTVDAKVLAEDHSLLTRYVGI